MAHYDQSLQIGTECVAKYDFNGHGQKDLSFKKGDILEISHSTKDPNWYGAKMLSNGKSGIIPISYVQPRRGLHLHEMPWFFGKITREKAESLLQPREIGLFLVRESTNYPGDYTLCVVSPQDQKVEHYRVISRRNKVTVDEERYFGTLVELVKYYEKLSDGLCTNLKLPLNKQKHMSISSQVFQDSFQKEGWAVPIDDVEFNEKIGMGEFGEVFRGSYQERAVAIKKLKDDTIAAQSFLAEASVMTTLHHKNLVDLVGISFQGQEIIILTEFCTKGALVDYLRSRGRAVITRQEQLSFARDVCEGMRYLEEKKVIHRDLAARNVLLSEELCAKVSDFGLAKDIDQQMELGKFPVKWTAPEAIRSNKFSIKSDVWSFGILLWEIFSFGRNPYPRVPLNEVLNKVTNGYRMESPDKCPPSFYSLMKACWDINPNNRPSFSRIQLELSRETNL